VFLNGDVLAVVATIVGLFLTGWATTVAAGLLFPGAAERGRQAVTDSPKRTVGLGIVLMLTLGLGSLVLLGAPLPLGKLLGWIVLLWLLSIAAVGLAGVARLVAERIQSMDPLMAAYPAYIRAAAFLVGACLLPALGWFVVAPMLLAASLGAGWRAVVARTARVAAQEAA